MNNNPGFSTDYRGLTVAKITAIHNPTTGPLAGRPVYEWTEQQISSTGADENALFPRKGVYTSATQFDNCLVELNDNTLTVGQLVWARMKGMTTGTTIYETVALPSNTDPDGPPLINCITEFVGMLDSACLQAYILAGADPGKCANISAAGPITLQPFGSYVWVADSTFPVAGGDALLIIYKDSNGDERGKLRIWTGSGFTDLDTGKSAGCVGSYTEIVFPPDDLICDDTGVVCGDNALHVRVVCIECPTPDATPTCDEASCPDGAPAAYSFTLAGGTTDFADLNGAWTIYYGTGTWTATRGGWTATLTLSGTTATLRFEFAADSAALFVEYTLDPIPADCCADITVAYSSHAGTGTRPTGPTLVNVGACGPCPTIDVACCSPVLLPETLSVTFGGVLSPVGTVTLTWDAVDSRWEGTGSAMTGGGADTAVTWTCTGSTWVLGLTSGSCSVTDGSNTATCSPFLSTPSGTIATVPPCASGAWTATVTE